ncbi:MAG: hypothetical protein U0L26_07130 [Cellulosilyticum sp.]|nr:hypothetical protein [Cellulosilyticum sp.]MEE1072147.1 hypothetical protein [Cellulosilyticum sp.]
MKRVLKTFIMALFILGTSLSSNAIRAEEVSLISVGEDTKLRVIVKEIEYIKDEGNLSDITIQERRAASLTESKDEETRTITLSLEGTRFNFTTLPKVTLKDGFKGLATPKVTYLDSSQKLIGITMPYKLRLNSKGKMTLSNLRIGGLDSNTGDVCIKIGALDKDSIGPEMETEILVAKIADYGVTLEAGKCYNIKAGESKYVVFKIKEILPGSLASGNTVEISLDKGYFKADRSGDLVGGNVYLNGVKITDKVELEGYDADGYITSFEIRIPNVDPNKENILTFRDFKVCTEAGDSGAINLTVEGMGIPEEVMTGLGVVQP